jgi:hypothetical protein
VLRISAENDHLANPVFGKRHLVKVAPVEVQHHIPILQLMSAHLELQAAAM